MLKKLLFVAFFAVNCATYQAQDTITFETINLAPESYNNGSAGTGGFTFGNAHFSNNYNNQWLSWSGFLISNTTDNSTPGFTNDFSSFTAGGYNSSTYAVFYDYDNSQDITFEAPGAMLESVQITNSTFSALAMRDGDFVSKQFGSIYDASGQLDGTNGEDFFKIWVYAYNSNNEKFDSLDFYLADFRFSDNALDYIVDSWTQLDLSTLNSQAVFKLTFSFESSDNGAFGINTPTYFAIDDLVFHKNLGVDENIISNFNFYPNPVQNTLNIEGEKGEIVLKDASGRILERHDLNQSIQLDFSSLPSACYFLEIQNEEQRNVYKIVK